MNGATRVYNSHQAQCKHAYRWSRTRKVIDAKLKDSREYWRLLSVDKHQPPDVPIS